MKVTSAVATLAALGLIAAASPAAADCHQPRPEGTVAEDHGAPLAAQDEEEVAALEDDELEAPEDSAILPSAEGHLESEAPTMEIDCQENPELCAGDPLLADSEGPTLSEGADLEAGEVNEAGDPVVAEADC